VRMGDSGDSKRADRQVRAGDCVTCGCGLRTADGCSGGDAGAAPRQVRTAKRRCRGGSAAGAAGRWTLAEEQPSGARGPPAALSLPLPSPTLVANASSRRFPAQRAIWVPVPVIGSSNHKSEHVYQKVA